MSLDFQQVRNQVKQLGEGANERARSLLQRRTTARSELGKHAQNFDFLRRRVQTIAMQFDRNMRCAMPATENPEPLDTCFPLPALPPKAILIAADGSQITPDRHAQVNYGLINVGAICLRLGESSPPEMTVRSQLLGDDILDSHGGTISDKQLSLWRDVDERQMLIDLAASYVSDDGLPVITFTDGPMEIWGGDDSGTPGDYAEKLKQYQDVLDQMRILRVATAGYVDKPGANLIVRLLEIAGLDEAELREAKDHKPYAGVTDRDLFASILEPYDRSAVFALQSRGQLQYREKLKVHFFYLNVGRPGHPWLARVEIPAWLATDCELLDNLHAVLVQQCRAMGPQSFPYILHRSHEAAVVTFEEKDQVTQMIVHELYRRGVGVGEVSHKQFAKDAGKRTSY